MPDTEVPSPATHPAVQRFCRQFLQVESQLDIPPGAVLRPQAVQEYLYERLFTPVPGAVPESGPPAAHVLRALKTLVRTIDESIDDWEEYGVSDRLVARLFDLAASSVADNHLPGSFEVAKNTVVYAITALPTYDPTPMTKTDPTPTVAILENRATLATGGTTGLRTWEAALHLGQYLCAHPALVAGKRILELGAGTGYVSILCAKHLQASHCIATDGAAAVVDNMGANLQINGLDTGSVSSKDLWWGEDSTVPDKIDVLLGADITFDERDMPALLVTIRQVVAANPAATVLIAATERNCKTFDAFVRLAESDFVVDMLAFPVPAREEQTGPFYSDAVPIHICQLQLRTRPSKILN